MQPPEPADDVTVLLKQWSLGDRGALDRLMEKVYPEIRGIALRYLQRQRSDHTLQSTALVNEAYLRMVQSPGREWDGRAHFFAVAARIIRSILVDYARAKQTAKRGGGALNLALNEEIAGQPPAGVDLLDLDSALQALQQIDPQQSRIVEMRFFGGLSIEETAAVLAISPATVKREWILAKTWIRRHMGASTAPGGSDSVQRDR